MDNISLLQREGNGEPISRQVSLSLITPNSLTEFKEFFKQSSNKREDGWMDMKTKGSTEWTTRWFVYQNGVLKHGSSVNVPENEFVHIPMDSVITLRQDNTQGNNTILVHTTEGEIFLRLKDTDEMYRWLFCFQKSVALVLTRLMQASSEDRVKPFKSFRSKEVPNLSSQVWLTELGHGHGRYRESEKIKNSSFGEQKRDTNLSKSWALTDENKQTNINLLEKYAEKSRSNYRNQNNNKNELLSVSPAIPILSSSVNNYGFLEKEKIATSFHDFRSRTESLEEAMGNMGLNLSRSDSTDSSHSSFNDDAEDDQDDMMFEMDEYPETSPSPQKPKKRHSKVQNTESENFSVGESFCNLDSPVNSYISNLSSNTRISGHGELRWICGHCSRLGPRKTNEDRFVQCNLPQDVDKTGSQGFFAVFDGHCGDSASSYLESNLMERIYSHPSFSDDLEGAIKETCLDIDKEFLGICREQKKHSGTTAIGAFLIDRQLLVFNIGDSQAVLCSSGVAVEMSDSHKPGRPDEMERIKSARGWITEEKELYMGRLHRMDLSNPKVRDKAEKVSWVTIHRVCGELAVSRSIGDPYYKQFIPGEAVDPDTFLDWPADHDMVFMADPVIAIPEFRRQSIGLEDKFLVIASDGLWDVISPSESVEIVKEAFELSKTPTEAAEELSDLALKLGSSDNVTVLVIQFLH